MPKRPSKNLAKASPIRPVLDDKIKINIRTDATMTTIEKVLMSKDLSLNFFCLLLLGDFVLDFFLILPEFLFVIYTSPIYYMVKNLKINHINFIMIKAFKGNFLIKKCTS